MWIAVSIIALVLIVVLLFIGRGRQRGPSNLSILGMSLIVLGIIFGDNRALGYSFIGGGVILMVIDSLNRRNKLPGQNPR